MILLDTADRQAIDELLATGMFAGVTTNPLILHRAGLRFENLPELFQFCAEREAEYFFAQATGGTVEQLVRSADQILSISDAITVKVPATAIGYQAGAMLAEAGAEICLTAVYHPTQVLFANQMQASFIAPYVARTSEQGRDGIELVENISLFNEDPECRILAASLRNMEQLTAALLAGADDVTINPDLAARVLNDELSIRAADEFERVAN